VRVAFASQITPVDHASSFIIHSGKSKVVSTVLPDGTKRTVSDDLEDHSRIIVDTHPDGSEDITNQDGSHTKYKYSMNNQMGHIDGFLDVAAFVALIVGTILAAPFGRENDGHLNIVWTRPFARERMALAIMGVDLVGLLGAYVLALIAALGTTALFTRPHLTTTGNSFSELWGGIIVAIAWYTFLNAATASLRRGYGAILGLAWPVSLVVIVLNAIVRSSDPSQQNALGTLMHNVFWAISRIDPLTYAHLSTSNASLAAPETAAPVFVLALVYGAAAIVQWRRVEA
jgi:hypothetical protein